MAGRCVVRSRVDRPPQGCAQSSHGVLRCRSSRMRCGRHRAPGWASSTSPKLGGASRRRYRGPGLTLPPGRKSAWPPLGGVGRRPETHFGHLAPRIRSFGRWPTHPPVAAPIAWVRLSTKGHPPIQVPFVRKTVVPSDATSFFSLAFHFLPLRSSGKIAPESRPFPSWLRPRLPDPSNRRRHGPSRTSQTL